VGEKGLVFFPSKMILSLEWKLANECLRKQTLIPQPWRRGTGKTYHGGTLALQQFARPSLPHPPIRCRAGFENRI
jgi:hypothetical protein